MVVRGRLRRLRSIYTLLDGSSIRSSSRTKEQEGHRPFRDYPASKRLCVFLPTESGRLFRRGVEELPLCLGIGGRVDSDYAPQSVDIAAVGLQRWSSRGTARPSSAATCRRAAWRSGQVVSLVTRSTINFMGQVFARRQHAPRRQSQAGDEALAVPPQAPPLVRARGGQTTPRRVCGRLDLPRWSRWMPGVEHCGRVPLRKSSHPR